MNGNPYRGISEKKEDRSDEVEFFKGIGSKGNILQISKKEQVQQHFDDGLYIQFEESKPNHLRFWCRTLSNEEQETCNVRLFKIDPTKSRYRELAEAETSANPALQS